MPTPVTDGVLHKLRHDLPLSVSEVAEFLGLDRNTVAANLRVVPIGIAPVVRPGEIPCRMFGRRKFIFPSELRGAGERPEQRGGESDVPAVD